MLTTPGLSPQTRRSHRTGLVLLGIAVTLVVAVRAYVSAHGYLYLDDYAFRYWAATESFGLDYLLHSYGGHVNPIGLAAQWVLQAAFPGSHLALVAFVMVLWAMTLALAAATVVVLTQRWQAGLIMVTVLGLGLLGFENSVWWAAAIYAAPYQFFLALGLFAMVRSLRFGGRLAGPLVILAYAGCLASYSRGLVAGLLLFAVAAGLPVAGQPRPGWQAAWRARRIQWSIMVALTLVWVFVIVVRAEGAVTIGSSGTGMLRYAWLLLVLNVLPALWGGPWRWYEIQPGTWHAVLQTPAPPWPLVWLAAICTLLAVATIYRRRPVLRGFLPWAGLLVAVVLGATAVARAGSAVSSVAYRYTFDLAWPFALVVTVALVPLWWEGRRPARWLWLFVPAFAASSIVSTVVPWVNWTHNEGRAYMASAVAGYSDIPVGRSVLVQGVPSDLVDPVLMREYANSQVVMAPQPGAPQFGDFAPDVMFGFSASGDVRRQGVAGPAAPVGPDERCGYRVTDIPQEIPLDGQLIAWPFYARVAYFTGASTSLNLAVGGQIHTVPLEGGDLRAVYLPVSGPGDSVLVSVNTPGAVVCLTELIVGNRVDAVTNEQVPLPLPDPRAD